MTKPKVSAYDTIGDGTKTGTMSEDGEPGEAKKVKNQKSASVPVFLGIREKLV